jgi:putative transposase
MPDLGGAFPPTTQPKDSRPLRRAVHDAWLIPRIRRVHKDNYEVYGACKVHKALRRDGIEVRRCRVERLMQAEGIQGMRRGRRKRTTVRDTTAARPQELVDQNFKAVSPNRLWVADLTFVATWAWFVHVAFVIDAYSRLIVGGRSLPICAPIYRWTRSRWRCGDEAPSSTASSTTPTPAANTPPSATPNVSQTPASSRRWEASATPMTTPSRRAPSASTRPSSSTSAARGARSMKWNWETLSWIDWFNHRRLHGACGDVPPAEFEATYYQAIDERGIQSPEPL